MNLTTVDHIAEGWQVLDRAERLRSEGTTLALREAAALREAQAMKSEALMGVQPRIRRMGCPACGCFTLIPKRGRGWCVNRHCTVAGRQRSWAYRELAFVGPGRVMEIRRTDTTTPPRDARPLRWLVAFFTETGLPVSASTLSRLATAHDLPRWKNPADPRAHLYSLSDMAIAHALRVAGTQRGECTKPSGRPPCTGLADLFFAPTPSAEAVQAAKNLCADCPLREVCGETAMTHPDYQQYGIFGGLTAAERKQLKKGGAR